MNLLFSQEASPLQKLSSTALLRAFLFFMLVINAVFLRLKCFTYFEPMDSGGFPALAYRFLEHQKPYIDFMFHNGPVYPVTMAFFMALFGFGKTAVYIHLIFTSSAYLLFTYWISKKFLSPLLTAFLLPITMIALQWFYPFPNFGTDALLWVLIGLWFLLRPTPFDKTSSAFWHHAGCAVFTTLALFTKYNVGLPFLVSCFTMAWLIPFRYAAVAGYLSGFFLTSLLLKFLFIPDVRVFLFENVLPYPLSGHYPLHWILKPDIFYIHAHFPVFFITVFYLSPYLKEFRNLVWLLCLSTLGAIFFYKTSSARLFCNIPLLLGTILLHQARLNHPDYEEKAGIFKFKFGLMILIGLGLIVMVYSGLCSIAPPNSTSRFRLEGPTAHNDYPIQTPPLTGWYSNTPYGQAVDSLANFINLYIPKTDEMAILTRMEVLYPLTRHKSFKGLPFNYFLPLLQSSEIMQSRTRNAILQNPPDWIIVELFPDRNVTIAPFGAIVWGLKLSDFLSTHYQQVYEINNFAVLRKVK